MSKPTPFARTAPSPGRDAPSTTLLEEAPVAVTINGVSQAVMLATPRGLEHYALGFCFSEGLIEGPQDVRDIEVREVDRGWSVDVSVSPRADQQLRQRRRTMAGPTGCGLCGVDSIDAAMQLPTPVAATNMPEADAIHRARSELPHHQALRHQSGGLHGAAFCGEDGRILRLAEDVGRHNALDKLGGALLADGQSRGNGFVLITSRCSHDLVVKTVRFGIQALISLSMATTLAVDTSRRTGLHLLCFQGDELLCYHDASTDATNEP